MPFPPLLDPEITEAPIRTPYNGYSSLFLKELGADGLMFHEMAHWWHNVNVFRYADGWEVYHDFNPASLAPFIYRRTAARK